MPRYNVEPAFPALTFSVPISAALAPDGTWLVVQQDGHVVAIDTPTASRDVLDYTARVASYSTNWEWGLLGLALHPRYADNHLAYLYYVEPSTSAPSGVRTVLAELTTSSNHTFDPASERRLLQLEQPGVPHKGGSLGFDAGGFLLVGIGDGGEKDGTRAQDPASRFGAILRIDVDTVTSDRPYGIPDDNPVIAGGAPEVFAYGFRNPWKWSLDRQTGTLWVGDVGENDREEIDSVTPGGNFGWPALEGTATLRAETLCGTCARPTLPVTEYCHDEGKAVIGGYVYRGTRLPELVGTYVFADFATGLLLGVAADAAPGTVPEVLAELSINVAGFVEDAEGELLLLNRTGGDLYRLVPHLSGGEPAAVLSQTGYVDALAPWERSASALPYEVRAPFFSDHADKGRWLSMPAAGRATMLADGDVVFPEGTVFTKRFERDGVRLETRLLMATATGWRGFSYAWRADGSDADLLASGETRATQAGAWLYPSRADCLRCHSAAAAFALGPSRQQLDMDTLDAWVDAGILTPDDLAASNAQAFPALFDPTIDIGERARAFLDVNCSSCHRPGGPGGGAMDLRASTPLALAGICDLPPMVNDFDLQDARLVASGAPERSVLVYRLASNGPEKMHPFRLTVDDDGLALVSAWVEQLVCP